QAKTLELEAFLKSLEGVSPALIVVLDHIEDPHNLGAVVRSAEAGGASCVIYAKRRAAVPNDTVIKTSAGASLRLPLIPVSNITRTIERLKESNFWAVGLDGKADSSLWDEALPERCALVIGTEGEGLSRLVSQTCDMMKRIPISAGGVSSLNASVAAALGVFEWTRNYIAQGRKN
ncbi:MAG: 23S rRNA (guanosine(2251)-2'-O)-methyltransferase RlmB, partial [Synergistaceae bacterium]|nr:23S rRNA (guanosine(2251)-2'-O)-methyltransferase RlmB [Synergistaceae bacterium]